MNNDQFRRLLFDSSPSQNVPRKAQSAAKPATPSRLGSRARSGIPMTPRTVAGPDFARQLAEHRREASAGQQPPTKKFKSASAPKGTRLPTGYQDRAQKRQVDDDDDGDKGDVEKRVKALEEMVKLGQMDRKVFEKLRCELGVGGDVGSTHMVKGLDWDLLRRVKAGEDVSARAEDDAKPEPEMGDESAAEKSRGEDVDEEFERVLEEKGQEVVPAAPKEKEEGKKKGSMAPPPPPKKSRDEILRQLKANRVGSTAAAESQPAESTLGTKFKSIRETKVQKQRFVEEDENGRRREVLLITDAEGNTKRKVKRLDKPGEANGNPQGGPGLLVPDKDAKPLGMDVPEFAKSAPALEDKDDDIFEGVGADYNPFGDIGDESSSESGGEDEVPEEPTSQTEKTPVEKPAEELSRPRNYFSASIVEPIEAEQVDRSNPFIKDPTIMAALKRAAALRQGSPSDREEGEDTAKETSLHRKNFLEEIRRREAQDAMDMDLGFGSSRIEDEEDEEGVVLEGGGSNKRKRGPKKRKGNKESASDVMRVLEGRKK